VTNLFQRVNAWIDRPMPVLRIEIVRLFAPLWILGFMSVRLIHADEWLGSAGYRVPPIPRAHNQPLWLPGLPNPLAWALVTVMVLSGLAASAGWKTRKAAYIFAATVMYSALSDRLAAFTVSKIGGVIMLAVALGPAGSRFGVDAWLALKRGEPKPAPVQPLGSIRFLQVWLPTFYCASGLAKAGGDWLTTRFVLYSHLHDSYQTGISCLLANITPVWMWNPLQHLVLVFEALAPIWFSIRYTRPVALVIGLGMHLMIGLMFGPVVWFALLMMAVLLGCYLPDWAIVWLDKLVTRFEDSVRPSVAASHLEVRQS
jgi:hypothetical protein